MAIDNQESSSDRAASVPAVKRAIAVIDLVAGRSTPVPLHAISRELGLPRSSTLGICRTLVQEGVLQQSRDGAYYFGPRLVQLVGQQADTIDLATAFARGLDAAGPLRWTAQLAALTGNEVIFLARRDGLLPISLVSTTGRKLPASTTGVGKAILARLTPAEVSALYPDDTLLPQLTDASITSTERLQQELAAIRETGTSTDQGETMRGIIGVGAAVYTAGHTEPIAAVSLVTTIGADDDEMRALRQEVALLAERVTQALGGRAPASPR